MEKIWQLFRPEEKLAQTISRELHLSPLVAQLLINRGIKTAREAEVFLNPRLSHLRDPMEIPNTLAAARRVMAAKEKSEKVLVFGDYDVDGVTGTAILVHTLRFLGIDTTYYIPQRYGEGYSLSLEAVKKIAAAGTKLIITVDCGSASFIEIEEANALGLEVIVTDHHQLPRQLPRAYALVNPKMIKEEHPSKNLSGAGVAFKFAWALLRTAGIKESEFLVSLLDLASLGTISDVVPLTEENRILAVSGLSVINERKRPGIKYLIEAASLQGKIMVENIYFALAPRINAAGRIEHASKSVELLLSNDPVEARTLAQQLNQINIRRQGIGSAIKAEVFALLEENYSAENKLVVLAEEHWHPGVIGIIASQVVDRYFRPTVLIGINDGIGRGSARSIKGLNIYELLDSCHDLFLDFGGHEGAAGFEILPENIAELKRRLQEAIETTISPEILIPKVKIDAEVDPAIINLNLIKELERIAPHGEGNSTPVFMSRHLRLEDLRKVGSEGKHLKAKFSNANITLEAIGFGLGYMVDQLSYEKDYDVAYELSANQWNGFEMAQLSLVDIREAGDGA